MRRLWVFVVVLGTGVASGRARASTADLIEKNFHARYAGPQPVGKVAAAPAPVDPKRPTVVEALEAWYAGELRKDYKALARRLKRLKPGAYNRYLAERKARAQGCADKLPAELQPDVEAFLSATEPEEQHSAIRKLRAAAKGQPREVLDCLDAVLVKLDSRGVLVGGLVWGKTTDGAEQLKATLYNPGHVHLLRPQVITAWPGRNDSALQVLDPRRGPWRVRLAHTHAEMVGMHYGWKAQPSIRVTDYTQKAQIGHFLIIDDKDAPLGWIDLNQAAFFAEAWTDQAFSSKFIYTSGAAAYAHGVWWNPKGTSDGSGAGNMSATLYQTPIYVIDLLQLVKMQTRPIEHRLRAPYPETMEIVQIRGLYRSEQYQDLQKDFRLLIEYPDFSRFGASIFGGEAGLITLKDGRLRYGMDSATVKASLRKLYRLPSAP